MQPCKYIETTKCKECTAVYYNSCKKFVAVHTAYLVRAIRPFKSVASITSHKQPVWSKDINKAKTVVLKNTLLLNHEVKKLSISQVLTIAISNQEIEGDNFYIECTQRPFGDPEKVKGVLTSFIDDLLLRGARVVVFVGGNMQNFTLEYTKI